MLNEFLQHDPETFFSHYWNQQFLHVTCSEHFQVPFDLQKFMNILKYYPLDYKQLRIFSDGSITPLHLYTDTERGKMSSYINKNKLLHPGFLHNKTLVLSNINELDAEMHAFSLQLEQLFGCPVKINAYYSTGQIHGANPHYDLHHLFAVQLAGEKHWSLGDIVVENPNEQYHPFLGEHSFHTELMMRANEILYVPPGLWHSVKTNEQSLHLTIGLYPPTWQQILQNQLQVAIKKHAILRDHVPFYLDDRGHCVYDAQRPEEIAQLFNLVAMSEPLPIPRIQRHFISMSDVKNEAEKQVPALPSSVSQLLDDIWHISQLPKTLYLRGSFAEQNPPYEPWDIDIVLLTNSNPQVEYEEVIRFLQYQGYNLSKIDLRILTEEDLENMGIFKLLVHQATFIFGQDVRSDWTVDYSKSNAHVLLTAQLENLTNKLFAIQQEEDTTPPQARLMSLVKAVLRLGGLYELDKRQYLEREPMVCANILRQILPLHEQQINELSATFVHGITAQQLPVIEELLMAIKETNLACIK